MPSPVTPWLDPARSEHERVELLLEQMTLPELVGQLHQSPNLDPVADADLLAAGGVGSTLLASGATAGNKRDAGVTRARVDALQHAAGASRLGIPLLVARDVIHGHRTVFPIPLGLAASFDEQLAQDAAARAALEAAADGITWTFAPMVDLVDDARWGRVAESLGESPLLSSRLGAAMVRGFQASGRVTACAKHYVGYGLSRGGRDYASVEVGAITLRNHHLRPFEAAVRAGVGTVMAAFSDVDGIPMHAHRHLLRDVLKGEWGFDGVVVADWNGIGELVEHGVAADLRDAARQAIEAGVDVDMVSGAYATHLADLVERGDVARDLVLDAARRVLRLKVRLGLLDPDCPTLPDPTSTTGTVTAAEGAPEGSRSGIDRDLAHRAALGALVVLADDGVLPLGGSATAPVLLTGAFAHERESLLGTWVLDGDPADVPSIAEELARALSGTADSPAVVVDDGGFPDRTLRRAREAGTTVALVGEHALRSGEDSATSDVGLPPGQLDQLRALRRMSARLVVVVLTGRPLALGEVLDLADALVLAFHPGTQGAAAIADVLTGRAQARGRLPMSLPRSSGHLPVSHAERPSGRPLGEDPRGLGRYLDAPTLPLVPFGGGVSPVALGPLRGPAAVSLPDGVVEVALEVRNLRDVAVRETVLLMMRDEVAEVTRPLRELIDVAVVDVPAHAAVDVTFTVPVAAFGYHGRDQTFRVDPGRVVLTAGWGRHDASSVSVEVLAGP